MRKLFRGTADCSPLSASRLSPSPSITTCCLHLIFALAPLRASHAWLKHDKPQKLWQRFKNPADAWQHRVVYLLASILQGTYQKSNQLIPRGEARPSPKLPPNLPNAWQTAQRLPAKRRGRISTPPPWLLSVISQPVKPASPHVSGSEFT